MIVDKINEYLSRADRRLEPVLITEMASLAAHAFDRQFSPRQDIAPTIRLSGIGRCLRQQSYRTLGIPENGKELDSRALMVFFQGDLAEAAVVLLAKAAGCDIQSAGASQMEIELLGVKGHPDGILGELLVEVKSMSSYSFEDFEHGRIDEAYLYQMNAYMEALHLNQAVMVALNKDAGVLGERTILRDQKIVDDILKRISRLRTATLDNLPERPYKPNEKGFYPWQCLYCAFHKTCLPHAERVLVGRSYKLKEKIND